MIDAWVYLAGCQAHKVLVRVINPGTGPTKEIPKPIDLSAITSNSLRDIRKLHCPHGVGNEAPNHPSAIPKPPFTV